MNDILSMVIDNNTPKFNKVITEGVAKQILKTAPEYLNSITESGMRSVNSSIGLVYHGWRKLTPKEEFNRMYSGKDNKVQFDIAHSDLYMIELRFTYKDKPISRVLYLPFASIGNLITLTSNTSHIVPVLSDTVLSPDKKKIFVRLMRAKLSFERLYRNFIVNGVSTPGQVVHAMVYNTTGRNIIEQLGKVQASVILYPLGNIGLRATLKKYLGIESFLITLDDATSYYDTHKVYESTRFKPHNLKEYNYTGHNLKIMIPFDVIKDHTLLDNVMFGIMNTLDIFPDSVNDLIHILTNHDVPDEKVYWRILLGRIVFQNSYSLDRIMSDMDEHFITLNSYVDTLIKTKLAESAIYVDDFFDLVMVILTRYNDMVMNNKEYNNDINNRYVDILYYLMYDLIIGINRTLFDINRKSIKKVLSDAEVNKMFNLNLPTKKIYDIVHSKGVNLAIMSADASGDIMYPKVTSMMEDQSRGNGVKRGSQSVLPEAMRSLSGLDTANGSVLYLTKSANSAKLKFNLFAEYNVKTGRFIIPDHVEKVTTAIENKLQEKLGTDVELYDTLLDEDELLTNDMKDI